MAAPTRKTVGVLGGLGPEATLDFFAKVIRATPASCDQEHLHLIIDNNPQVPDRNRAIAGQGPSPGPALADMARRLEAAGAEFLVMVCNAAHAFAAEITQAVSIPLVSIIDETVAAALRQRPQLTRTGVLAASGCLEAGLYQRAFAAQGVTALVLAGEQQARFMDLLYRIKAGDKGEAVKAGMLELALALHDRGAELIVAGCTEVPLVLAEGDLPCPLVSSSDVLAERTVAYATGAAELPEGRA